MIIPNNIIQTRRITCTFIRFTNGEALKYSSSAYCCSMSLKHVAETHF